MVLTQGWDWTGLLMKYILYKDTRYYFSRVELSNYIYSHYRVYYYAYKKNDFQFSKDIQ